MKVRVIFLVSDFSAIVNAHFFLSTGNDEQLHKQEKDDKGKQQYGDAGNN